MNCIVLSRPATTEEFRRQWCLPEDLKAYFVPEGTDLYTYLALSLGVITYIELMDVAIPHVVKYPYGSSQTTDTQDNHT